MAINVDTVYKTVLLILNKEQRGYMTPDEFNKVATQVQLETFESYFEDLNQQLRIPENDSEYSNRIKNLEEQIAVFKTIGNCTNIPSTNQFNLPVSSGVTVYPADVFKTVVAQSNYVLTNLTQAQIQNGTTKVYFAGVLQSSSAYSIASNSITLTTPPATVFTVRVEVTANDFYRLGTVIYDDSIEMQRVQRNDLLYINKSPLTKPTRKYPLYIYAEEKLFVYPTDITTGVTATFVRKPKDVIWNFTASPSTNYTYLYNPNTSQQFELMPSEQTNVITKILMYSGVIIKDPQIVQAAAQQIQNENINSKS
jgi:hypothetical protein